jgi:hypothetical protein
MFFTLGLNKEKSLFTSSLFIISLYYLSISNPAKKNYVPQFLKQWYIISYYFLLPYIISKERDKK